MLLLKQCLSEIKKKFFLHKRVFVQVSSVTLRAQKFYSANVIDQVVDSEKRITTTLLIIAEATLTSFSPDHCFYSTPGLTEDDLMSPVPLRPLLNHYFN